MRFDKISRIEASIAGLKKFFTGEPCINGHISERYIIDSSCFKCKSDSSSLWRKNNREKARKCQNDWNANNSVKIREACKKSKGLPKSTRPCPKDGLCECCHKPETIINKTGKVKSLSLDHCHNSGEFRGWLCFHCNSGIGKLGDNLEGVYRAVNYLIDSTDNEILVCV
jgi:hypothetical protein